MNHPRTTAVIVAAGSSTRMGGISKQLINICSKPVIAHTIEAFEQCETVDDIIIVTRQQDMMDIKKIISSFGFKKIKSVICGGETRQQSVKNGLSACDCEYIAIHDGARALILPQDIDNVISQAYIHKAAMLGVAMKDTVKIVNDDGMTVSTADRSKMWLAQTPQVFEAELIKNAMQTAERDGLDLTDESQLIENSGQGVYMVKGSYDNIKITTPEDIALAERILCDREKTEV